MKEDGLIREKRNRRIYEKEKDTRNISVCSVCGNAF